jgi:hypothetical protein
MPKIPNVHVPRYVTTSAVQAVRAAINDAIRLGLTWRLRPGTVGGIGVAAPESVPVRVDGDATTIRVRSMVGALVSGQRVWCIQVPPAGVYVLGVIGSRITAPTPTVFTASGTWTPPAGLTYARVRGVGGGGQGGGCAATIAGQVAEAAGGSSGGYCESLLDASDLGSTVTVTVGAGGTGGAAGANGTTGGPSMFGSFWTANGGGGGTLGAATAGNAASDAAAGGSASGGNIINIRGSEGGNGRVINLVHVMGNHGAASHLGAEINNATANTTGVAGQLYGSGASGSRRSASQAAVAGLAGAAGIVIVEAFYS